MSTLRETDLSYYLTHPNPQRASQNDLKILGLQYLFIEFNTNIPNKVEIR